MGQHLNRLTKTDAIEFDKAFVTFCKTRVWVMGQAKRIEEERLVEKNKFEQAIDRMGQELKNDCKELKKNQFMADPSQRGRFLGSRDWDLEGHVFLCGQKKCAANITIDGKSQCVMPSLIAIDSHGKCVGYKPRKTTTKGKPKRKHKENNG